MHEQDHAHLQVFCGGEIPKDTQKAYQLFSQCWMTFTNGPIPAPVLAMIAVFSGGVQTKQRAPSRFDEVKEGTLVYVRDSFDERWQYENCEFQSVGEGIHSGHIEVKVYGERMWFEERRVVLKSEVVAKHLPVIAEKFSEDENGDLVEEEVDDNPDNIIADMEDTEWSKIESGRKVRCEVDGEIKMGVFLQIDPNNANALRVKLDGIDVDKQSFTKLHHEDVRPVREIAPV